MSKRHNKGGPASLHVSFPLCLRMVEGENVLDAVASVLTGDVEPGSGSDLTYYCMHYAYATAAEARRAGRAVLKMGVPGLLLDVALDDEDDYKAGGGRHHPPSRRTVAAARKLVRETVARVDGGELVGEIVGYFRLLSELECADV